MATAKTHPEAGDPVIGAANHAALPKFWADDPALWFVEVENQISLHRITTETRQYEHLIDALPIKVVAEVRDILLAPLGATHYTTLKEALIARLVASEPRLLRQLFGEKELGHRRPTQFLRHL